MRAADALFSSGPSRNGAADAGRTPSTAALPSDEAERAAPERAGRVLRVIDEAPSPQLVALEAERAPKRRGRKPGSKNKPKLAAVAPTSQDVEPSAEYADVVASTDHRVASARPTFHTPRQVAALAAAPAPQTDASGKRFSWVRDRLKPGEGWKRRRLPRVCW